jgi:regulator of sigma E protease
MDNPTAIQMIVAFLLVLGPLIFLHELGHFIAAKRGGIRAVEFGMGYPPRLRRLWRGKGFVVIDGVRYNTPRNFDLSWDWPLYLNKQATLTYNTVDGVAQACTLELDPAEEQTLLNPPNSQPQSEQAAQPQAIARVDGQAVQVAAQQPAPQTAPQLLKKRAVKSRQPGAHTVSGIIDEIDAGTEYTLNILPLGGFVRMYGEEGATGHGSFNDAPKRWRATTLLAGPGMNFLVALIVFTLTYMLGYPEIPVSIREIAPNSPASAAGMQTGDTLVSIAGAPIRRLEQVRQIVDQHAGQPVEVVVERDGITTVLSVTPRLPSQVPPNQGKMGVVLGATEGYTLVQHPFGESIGLALGDIADTVQQIVTLPTRLLSGVIAPQEAQVVGPVGISQFAAAAVEQTVQTGEWFWILNLFAAISLALGITNLLPLPALDGGRLIFVILEAIRHKRIAPEREAMVHLVGMALLLGLMVLITIQDISRLGS